MLEPIPEIIDVPFTTETFHLSPINGGLKFHSLTIESLTQ